MSNLLRHFERNTRGRDLIVGDIHGHFTVLQAQLVDVGFDPDAGDRLFSVGDLVDRGPESDHAAYWLEQPWFFAVQGNHEDMAVRFADPLNRMDVENYGRNGGSWNIAHTQPERLTVADTFRDLPLAIEIETAQGLIGIVHADCPFGSWDTLRAALAKPIRKSLRDMLMWSRLRIESGNAETVEGVRAVVVGHIPVQRPVTLGNVIHIDTTGWMPHRGGRFTFLDAATLCPAERRLYA